MTESEAIDLLIGQLTFNELNREAKQMAIKALEKQISKKPIPIDYEKYMGTVKNALFLKGAYWCPNCKHVVKCGTYCSDCGQKLDWSERID